MATNELKEKYVPIGTKKSVIPLIMINPIQNNFQNPKGAGEGPFLDFDSTKECICELRRRNGKYIIE
jgi:hypothetical protein